MTWSPHQDDALKAVAAWSSDKKAPQVFRLFGYAGTGKTTLARYIAEGIDGKVMFGAFTGKASLVLRSKGCVGANTIHSMIYRIEDESFGAPKFVLNHDSDVKDAALVIIDECSMVDEELGKDLLRFGTKVLVLGDPAQLPPVRGAGFFTNCQPDIMLTEVHRQARDNPIIRMSMTVRDGGKLDYGVYDGSRVVARADIDAAQVLSADQVLVGKNATRRQYNDRIRRLKNINTALPIKGDRLVCLKNNRTKGLLNGGIWSVEELRKSSETACRMRISPEDAGSSRKHVDASVHPYFFAGREDDLEWKERKKSDEFDFGYALTVHKSQGSQWDSVMLFDESGAFRDDRARWLYTGITRAAKNLTLVVN